MIHYTSQFMETMNKTKIVQKVTTDLDKNQYPIAKFISDLKVHSITMEFDFARHEALVSDMSIGHCNPVELTLLLKQIVHELKKYNINHVIQQVSESDWHNVLKEHGIFQFVNENKLYKFYNVKCELDRFPEAVMRALSFAPIHE